jgi:beta-galactosidase/beta-glucuronidase
MEQIGMGGRREFLRHVAYGSLGLGFYGFSTPERAFAQLPISRPGGASPRQRIRFQNAWKFQKEPPSETSDFPQIAPDFDDQTWEVVGVPHCYNDTDTYENRGESRTFQGNTWYRTKFTLPLGVKGRKIFLEFQGVTNGAAVYVNGKFKPGNTEVRQPGDVTHVGSFLPFVLDITDEANYGAENALAVRVGNISGTKGYGGNPDSPDKILSKSFFTNPGFGTTLDLGMGLGGIVCPVFLVITSPVHVPSNSYSPLEKWGTSVGTISTSDEKATIRAQTNVENESEGVAQVTVVTRVLDADGNAVLTLNDTKPVRSGEIVLFDQSGDLGQPQLWYPNNSPYGKPYLYRVVSDVQIGGGTVDVVESPLGIRTITWDSNFCYVNGKKHLLTGFGHRNLYPAVGAAIPASLLWNDVRLIAECGGNFLRIGHVPAMAETLQACDAYGVMVIQQSGDNEWALYGEPAVTYKKEYDRDSIIAFRNHPSIGCRYCSDNSSRNGRRKPSRRDSSHRRSKLNLHD